METRPREHNSGCFALPLSLCLSKYYVVACLFSYILSSVLYYAHSIILFAYNAYIASLNMLWWYMLFMRYIVCPQRPTV